MDITVSELMGNFMDTPLVVWVKTFGPLGSGPEDKLSMFMDLVDGVFLHKIMTHIDPSPTNQRVNKNVNNDVNLRIQNLNIVIRHIKNYYQEHLQQLILMTLPNVLTIAKDPLSVKGMDEMKRLLLLILGCAVQCERKEEIIEKIKLLDIEKQAAIVSHIQEVTHNQENVLDMQWLELPDVAAEELDLLSRNMALHLRKIIDERDESAEVIVELTQERDYLQSQQPSNHLGFPSPERTNLGLGGPVSLLSKEDRQHLAVELADTKAKLRRSRQELEEKTEQLMDTKHELERLDLEMQKLKQENQQLLAEARSVRAYRDEVDALREKAAKVDRLDTELSRCKERLNDVHFYKSRVEELREDNVTLMETKAMLEEQLRAARGRCDKLHELEKENLQLRSKLHDMEMDRDTDKKRLEELVEENMLLEISQKQSMNESAHLGWELEQLAKNNENNDTHKSFVFELNESTSSRLLKLEKENQSLQSTIQELRQASLSLEEGQLHTLELERENQGLSKKLERLQTLLDQEKQTTQDMEGLGEDLLRDKQKLQKALETVQAEKERQISELEKEKEHLSQAVGSLRQRAQADSEARVREVEKENRVLHQTITDTGSKVARLEAQGRQASKELETLRERGERCEELEREMARLERSREQLQREVASLKITCDRAETLERENATLEQDNRRLKKQVDAAQNLSLRLATLEKDHSLLDLENLELRRTVESLRPAAVRLAQLQQENGELEKEREELARSVEELRSQAKRAERLELSVSSLGQENQRLQQSLDNTSTKIQGLEKELRQSEAETGGLKRELEEVRLAGKRLEAVEKEKRGVEQELGQSEKERKQLEKEARRLWQQLEVKERVLEESSLRLASLEKEGFAKEKELERLREVTGKVKELERENKELQKQATIDKRTLATLREDLVNEKLKVQQQWNELETLNHELEKIGLNKEKLLQEEHNCDDNKYKILESKIESTLKKTLAIREEKIQGLESRLEESSSLNQQLRTELSTVKKTLEALRQRQEEEEAHTQSSPQKTAGPGHEKEKWETETREATAELLKLKDRLIDIEKNNATLQTEKHLLKEQLRQLDNQNSQLNAQNVALQRQSSGLQEHNTALHTQTAKLQVENSALNSQSASLMAQNAVLQGQVGALESESEAWQRQREEARLGRESVLQDHERLLSVHERQAAEYEQLISQHATLKSSQRALEQEHRALENKYLVLLKQKDATEVLESTLQKERESLGEEIHKNALIRGENQSLKGEVERLNQTHTQLRGEYDGLQAQTKELKASLNGAQLEVNRWQARYDSLKERHQCLDISMAKLDNHCELLTRLKGNLEEENHHLLSQIQMLSQQNQTLLERTMESKELYHEEQKQYIDKLNSLRRQKEKLEEKIMDQYKFYDPSPKKRTQWAGAKALVKLIKPKSRQDNSRERARSVPDIPLPQTPTLDFPDVPPPLSPPPLPPRQTHLSLDSAGSRSFEESHMGQVLSPTLTPNPSSRALNDSGVSRGREMYRTPGGSSESVNGTEEHHARRRGVVLGGAAAHSTPVNHTPTSGLTPNSSSRSGHRPRGFIYEEDSRVHSPDTLFGSGVHGNAGYRPGSADLSRNTSSSNSPVNCKDSLERQQVRSASLSSDDVAGLSHDTSLPRSATVPYDTPVQKSAQSLAPRPSRHRSSSPGSEMVTLEEFLEESNTLSPPTVQTDSREDLMADYFNRTGERERSAPGRPSPLRDGAKTPTSYVTPTVKRDADLHRSGDGPGRTSKPGQSVKPCVRLPEGSTSTPLSHSQTLPNRASNGSGVGTGMGVRPSPLGPPGTRSGGQGSSASLSRTFSLASADLLRSNGPDGYRTEREAGGRPGLGGGDEGVVRRPGAGGTTRERPQSARLAGPSDLDPRRLPLAPPKEEAPSLAPPQHHSSSLSLQPERYGVRAPTHRNSPGTGAPQVRPAHPQNQKNHRGEVAMVTPVRAMPALRPEEAQEEMQRREARLQADSPMLKKPEAEGGVGDLGCTEEHPKSTPASPDPNNDPQTVWYEYGCV
ncbi:protein Daple isoform X1 [Esox lucius]|uniref:Calponin-homology (CH) domain-containing protein n=1 Tax=Esox lucius TaxID=8010 RepID=A0A3P8ZKZ7_ESOLU|nr:protein Daple isoform X1 [Esox lucius]